MTRPVPRGLGAGWARDTLPRVTPTPPQPPEPRAIRNTPDSYASERNAVLVSLGVGVGLMLIKFAAFFVTGSSAIFSDALESIVNVLASGFALWAVRLSYQPADETHPYGHGKVEFLSAALEGAMIALAAVVILFEAIRSLIAGATITESNANWGALLIAIAMLVNGVIGFYLIAHGKKVGSIALEADGKHLLSDAVTSAVVLAALFVVKMTGWHWVDPLCAIAVAIYIAVIGLGLVRRSAAGLMDEQDPDDDLKIRALLDAHVRGDREPKVCSYHALRHRHTGRYHWVDFHLVVPADWGIARAHEAASVIEGRIEKELHYADATAHIEPCVAAGCKRCAPARAAALAGV